MNDEPNIATVAALIGDPARATMLTALMDGRALTVTELAQQAGVAPCTANGHLSKLEAAGLLSTEKQGRYRYIRLSGSGVASILEGLMGLAARTRHVPVRTGPKDLALRKARVCYDHLAGDRGVRMFDSLEAKGFIAGTGAALSVTDRGQRFFRRFGIELHMLSSTRRPLCRACLDWSERRSHLAGALGAVILHRLYECGWAARESGGRALLFSREGGKAFDRLFAPLA
jgi:DNA-binding transcriptional ArsR family regulator/ribosomal protein S19E (S16A)